MAAFKQLLSKDVTVTPIELVREFEESGSLIWYNNNINFFYGVNSEIDYAYVSSNALTGLDNSQHQQLVYDSILHQYYSNYYTSSINTDNYFVTPNTSGSQYRYWNYLESDVSVNRYYPTGSGAEISVISIPRNVYGDFITPQTFYMDFSGSIITDDGEGNVLYSGSNIGNIIYSAGLVIITTGSLVNLSDQICNNGKLPDTNIRMQSRFLVYEGQYKCTVSADEFNFSQNPSLISGSEGDIYSWATGSFTPYVTTIGLYNDNQDLLLVAKLSSPIRLSATTDTVFQINLNM